MPRTVTVRSADESVERLTARAISRYAPLVLPWLVAYGFLPLAGWGTHRLWGAAGIAPYATAALTLTTVITTAVAWKASHGLIGRIINTLTMLGAMSWLVVATVTGPGARPTLDLLLWGGFTASLTWSVRRIVRGGGDDDDGLVNGMTWARALDRMGIEGKARVVEASDIRSRARLQLEAGTPRDVMGRGHELAAALRVPPGGVRMTPDPDRGDRMEVTVITRDLLKHTIPWQGPAVPVGSCITAGPVVVGRHEDGEDAGVWLCPVDRPGRERTPGTHLLINGMTNSGKSMGGGLTIAGDLLCRFNAHAWAFDCDKATQTVKPLLGALDWFEQGEDGAYAMLDALKAVIPARTERLAELDLREWEPGHGMPYLIVWGEEAHKVTHSGEFNDVAKAARSAGIGLVISMQRSVHSEINTTARAQFGAGMCFGVRDPDDAMYVLGDDLVARGADPSVWKADKPGYAYLTAPEMDDAHRVMPLRAFLPSKDILTQVVEWRTTSGLVEPMDPVTAAAAGARYAAYKAAGGHAGAPRSPHTALDAGPVAHPAPSTAGTAAAAPARRGGRSEAELRAELATPTAEERALADLKARAAAHDPAVAAPEDPDAGARLLAEPSGPLDLRPAEQMDREAAVEVLYARLRELRGLGMTRIGNEDIHPHVMEATGRGRSWVTGELSRLVDAGRLIREDRGAYRFPAAAGDPDAVPAGAGAR